MDERLHLCHASIDKKQLLEIIHITLHIWNRIAGVVRDKIKSPQTILCVGTSHANTTTNILSPYMLCSFLPFVDNDYEREYMIFLTILFITFLLL